MFLRTSQCNLRCWWCDTPYTWHWEGAGFAHRADAPDAPATYDRAAETLEMEVEAAADAVLALDCDRLVLTGGEPMLQARALAALLERVKAARPHLVAEIETNATLAPPPALDAALDQINASPKLASSRNDPALRRRDAVLAAYARDPRARFKFVIADADDLAEVDALLARFHPPRDRVFLMPEGVTAEALAARSGFVAEAALARGVNFTPRLHILLYGDERGT